MNLIFDVDVSFRRHTVSMTRTTCGLKASSMGSGIKVAGAESLGGIPESLVVYGAVSTLSVLLYLVVRRTKCSQTCRIGGSSPSFFDLLRGAYNFMILPCFNYKSLWDVFATYRVFLIGPPLMISSWCIPKSEFECSDRNHTFELS